MSTTRLSIFAPSLEVQGVEESILLCFTLPALRKSLIETCYCALVLLKCIYIAVMYSVIMHIYTAYEYVIDVSLFFYAYRYLRYRSYLLIVVALL